MNKKMILSVLSNLLVFVMEIFAFILCIVYEGPRTFIFYTTDSNVLAGIICGVLLFFQILKIKTGKEIPYLVKLLKYIATCLLTVTFLTVLFILIPASGNTNEMIRLLFSPKLLFHHTLCPIICIVSFIFFEKDFALDKKVIIYSLIPTLIYALILIILNVLKIVEGPYFFLRVYEQPLGMSILWLFVMMLISIIISFLLWLFNRDKKENK